MLSSSVWVDKYKYDDAEEKYFTLLTKPSISIGNYKIALKCALSKCLPIDMYYQWNDAEKKSKERKSPKLKGLNGSEDADEEQKSTEENPAQYIAADIKWANYWPCKESERRYYEWVSVPTIKLTSPNGEDVKERKTISVKAGKNHKKEQFIKPSNERETIKCNLSSGGTIADKIASCRQHIQKSLGEVETAAPAKSRTQENDVHNTISDLQKANAELRKAFDGLKKDMDQVLARLAVLEAARETPQKKVEAKKVEAKKEEPEEEDDDDVDLFGSDSEEEDEKAKEEREKKLAAYAAKKAKKPGPIAKSNVIFDVKPWDDETDMQEMEKLVRTVATDGLLWGASKLVPLAYGIKKLQISCVVEDEKVSIDWLQETIEEFEDLVQSVDIAAFNKI